MMILFDEFEHAGPNCYWMMLGLCAAKLEKPRDAVLTESDCVFRFHERILREKFRLTGAKVLAWLNQCEALGLLSFQKHGPIFEISMPKLLEIADRDAKRSRPVRAADAPTTEEKEEKEQQQGLVVASSDQLIKNLPDEAHARLRAKFPDPKFVVQQAKKCFDYYAKKPADKPATFESWERAIASFCTRNWPDHLSRTSKAAEVELSKLFEWNARAIIMHASRFNAAAEFDTSDQVAGDEGWRTAIAAAGGWEKIHRMVGSDDEVRELARVLSQHYKQREKRSAEATA